MIPSGARRAALLVALTCISVAIAGCEERESPPGVLGFRDTFPLQFDSESVHLFLEGDTLRVEGTYTFLCRESESPLAGSPVRIV